MVKQMLLCRYPIEIWPLQPMVMLSLPIAGETGDADLDGSRCGAKRCDARRASHLLRFSAVPIAQDWCMGRHIALLAAPTFARGQLQQVARWGTCPIAREISPVAAAVRSAASNVTGITAAIPLDQNRRSLSSTASLCPRAIPIASKRQLT